MEEYHPLEPFLPENAKVLFLGSFPPPRQRWCMDFYYPNFQNDHWRIEGAVWFNDKNYFIDLERKSCHRHYRREGDRGGVPLLWCGSY